MTTDTINGELSIAYPRGFVAMGIDELKRSFGVNYQSVWGVQDKRRHAILAVFWKEASQLMAKVGSVLAREASLARRAEQGARRAYRMSDYQLERFFGRELAGVQAQGFAYSFADGRVRQQAQTLVFKRETRCYTLYYFTHEDRAQANEPAYEEMLASLTWV